MATAPSLGTELPTGRSTPGHIHLLIIGPHGSGKSNLRRALQRKSFVKAHKPSFLAKGVAKFEINDASVPVDIWDATEQSWPAIVQLVVDAVLLCVDITNPKSIEEVEKSEYFDTIMKRHKDMPVILIGCKGDLRAASDPEALLKVDDWCKAHNVVYQEWSALNGEVEKVIAVVKKVTMENERREFLHAPQKQYKSEPSKIEGLASKSVALGIRTIMNTFADRRALGERMLDENGERMMRFKWTTYRQLGEKIRNFGVGLKSLVPTRSFVCICAENSVNWLTADLGVQTQNMVGVTVHHTVPDEDIDFVVSNSQIDAAVAAPHRAKAFAKAAAANPKLRVIVVQPTCKSAGQCTVDIDALLKECREIAPDTRFLLHDDLEAIGSALEDSFEECTDPQQLFTISYTSGSTGRPKGMMVSHSTYRSLILDEDLGAFSYTIYMPLSHTSRLMAYAIMRGGGRTTLFNGDMAHLLEELQLSSPSEIIAVPRFWNIMYGEFNEVVSLYQKYLPSKGMPMAQHTARLLFERFLGGALEAVAAGGAPSSPEVFDWLHGFSFPGTETYGSTECGVFVLGHKILPMMDYKLLDVPEMGYTTQDKPFPRGEICAKTRNLFMGYHNNPEETKAAFTEDGYFRTGDIVQLEGPQFIRVIDRRKFIFKLSQGEYVSPAKSEGAYGKSPFISHIMAYGNSLRSYLVAVVVPNEAHLMSWAESHGVSGMTYEQLCLLPDIKTLLMNEIHNCELTAQLRPYEKVRNIFVTSENFTPDNGLLTATSKLNRAGILAKFRAQLDALYDAAPNTSGKKMEEDHGISTGKDSTNNSEALRQLKSIVAGSLSRQVQESSITNDMHLASSGLDSLAALRLVNTIKEKMKISVPIASLYKPGMTVESLAQVVSATQSGTVQEETAATAQEQHDPMLDASPYFWFPELLPSYADGQKMLNEAHLKKKKADAEAEKQKKAAETASNSASTSGYTDPATVPGSHLFTDIKYTNIFLTGATGFLGIYLLADLLEAFPLANVHCLVRASSDEEAMKRLEEAIEFAHMAQLYPELRPGTAMFARIKAVAGDLGETERFGMSQAKWDYLCDHVDSIYHNGVWVNLLFPYEVLRNANVVSTVLLLKMAMSGAKKRKAFHYISTLSAMAKSFVPTPVSTDTITADSDLFGYTGYPLTKRVCEVLISRVEELVPDLPVVIFRAGAIFAHSKTGHVNIIAFIHKLFCGMVQYGYYPSSKSQASDWAPVDFYSKAITHISKTGGPCAAPRRYNVSSPVYNSQPWSIDEMASFIRSAGYKLDPKPSHLWRDDLFKHFDAHPGTNLLEPLRQLLTEGTPGGSFDLTKMLEALKRPDGTPLIECPPITEQHIHAVLKFCAEKGYIPAPTH